MSDYPIARVSVKDEETGEYTPSDIRTRAEAVAVDDGRNAQQHLDEMAAHMNNLAIHSDAYIKTKWEVAIPTTGWVQEAPLSADFPYSLELPYEGVLDTHNAEIVPDNESYKYAYACRICPTVETRHNKLKFWAGAPPTDEIICHMTLFGEGGISGGNQANQGGGGT